MDERKNERREPSPCCIVLSSPQATPLLLPLSATPELASKLVPVTPLSQVLSGPLGWGCGAGRAGGEKAEAGCPWREMARARSPASPGALRAPEHCEPRGETPGTGLAWQLWVETGEAEAAARGPRVRDQHPPRQGAEQTGRRAGRGGAGQGGRGGRQQTEPTGRLDEHRRCR